MLEGPSYLVSRDLTRACEQESTWIYTASLVTENSKEKRRLEEEEDIALRKSLKLADCLEKEETVQGFHDLSLSQRELTSNGQEDANHSDRNDLIHQIGRDLSVNCLLHCPRSDYGSIASLNQSFRSLVRSGELYKLRRMLGIVEHWVYLSCNLLEWDAFDPNTGRWMHLPTMTSNECFMCSDKESLAVGTELLVFGKEIESHAIYKYSLLTNSWSPAMRTHTPRCLFSTASLGEIAIVAGGCDSTGNVLSSVELYNSETGTWEILPSMNKARKLCSGVFMDGKLYVLGGVGAGSSNILTSGEVYDLKTRSWVEIPEMFPARGETNDAPATAKAPPLLAVVKNQLYAAFYAEKEVLKYNKERNSWSVIGRLPEQATSVNGWGLAFKACGDKLITIGGPRAMNGGFIEINSWEPDQGEGQSQWNLLGRKHLGSFVYNCAVMGC
ncbi:F-box/kelch-repeat protein At1g74510 [Ipomoea triloba]|uniref:F-box/kelch-repeat protein At1g74510 n=1 Tax=Ipomoea triloba TaxID=35885 RepID=UPI00125E22B4|nr:F-box/kelch-repeat protein At1g74510 [Ipomoea triloba]XP_031105830.1 F-box/kelch-repeat protein At1g74510 [Ipomoea triloba]